MATATEPMISNGVPDAEHPDYPEFYLGQGLHAQLVRIGPELATEWLGRRAPKQRKMKGAHFQCLVDDIAAGRFRLNGETIIFDCHGRLIDGQHRLTAVIKTGRPILSVVIRGVGEDAYHSLDISAKRSGADALESMGYGSVSALSAAALLLWRYENGEFMRNPVASPMVIQEIITAHPGLVESVRAASKSQRICLKKGTLAFCHYVMADSDKGDADEFFDRLASGEELKKGSPILALRRRLIETKPETTAELAAVVFKAWNYYRAGRDIVFLRWSKEEAFPEPA